MPILGICLGLDLRLFDIFVSVFVTMSNCGSPAEIYRLGKLVYILIYCLQCSNYRAMQNAKVLRTLVGMNIYCLLNMQCSNYWVIMQSIFYERSLTVTELTVVTVIVR